MMRAVALLALMSFAAPAAAEISFCNGRWTNLPCTGEKPTSLPEQNRVLSPGEAMSTSRKRSLFHDLNMKAIRAKQEFAVAFDVSAAEDVCLSEASAVDVCQRKVDELDDRLTSRINEAILVREEQRANDLRQERNRQKAMEPAAVSAVTIINNTQTIIVPDERPRPIIRRPAQPVNSGQINIQGTENFESRRVQSGTTVITEERHSETSGYSIGGAISVGR